MPWKRKDDVVKKVTFDIDGVLYPYWHSLVYLKYFSDLGFSYTAFWKQWADHSDTEKMRTAVEDTTMVSAPYSDVGIIKMMQAIGKMFEVHYVTVRPEKFATITHAYLTRNGFPNFRISNLHMANTTNTKIAIIDEISPVAHVDDRTNIVIEVARLGINAILVNQPWNERVYADYVYYADHILDVLNVLKDI